MDCLNVQLVCVQVVVEIISAEGWIVDVLNVMMIARGRVTKTESVP